MTLPIPSALARGVRTSPAFSALPIGKYLAWETIPEPVQA